MILAVTLIGGSTALAGLGAWWRRPDRFAGPLLVAAAWAWFIGATSWAIGGGALQGYYVLLIAGLVLAYPSGRLGAVPRLILVAMLAVVLASTLGRMLFEANPGGFSANCYPPEPLCAPVPGAFVDAALGGGNSDELDLYDNLDLWFQLALLAGAALAVAVVAGRWALATGPAATGPRAAARDGCRADRGRWRWPSSSASRASARRSRARSARASRSASRRCPTPSRGTSCRAASRARRWPTSS